MSSRAPHTLIPAAALTLVSACTTHRVIAVLERAPGARAVDLDERGALTPGIPVHECDGRIHEHRAAAGS